MAKRGAVFSPDQSWRFTYREVDHGGRVGRVQWEVRAPDERQAWFGFWSRPSWNRHATRLIEVLSVEVVGGS